MKKIVISLALVLVLCFSLFLISCGDTHTGCTHEYDNTNCDTKCNLCGKPYHNGHEMVTPSIEGCQVPSYCTRCDYQTCEELIIEHLFVDENGNALEKCARCNALNPNAPEPEKIHTTTYQYTYDYGEHILGELTLLCKGGYLSSSFGAIERPKDIVAGDIIKIVYTGKIMTQESYPSTHLLTNGRVISYSFEYASVIHLEGDEFSIEKIKSCYDYRYDYVILDRTGKYISLDEYTGTEIYLVTDQKRLPDYGWNGDFSDLDVEQPDKIIPIASMFAYNPRDFEDGVNVRSQKVTINLNKHIEYPWWSSSPSNKYAGYIGCNENLNQYIKYAPNTFSYSVKVTCKDSINEALALAQSVIKDNPNILLSTLENQILLEFSNFDAYSAVQEELLDGLSNLESVEKIKVDYDETGVNAEEIESYKLYTGLKSPDIENKLITTYADFIELFDLTDEQNAEISKITEKTFEYYYVLYYKFSKGKNAEWIAANEVKLIDGNIHGTLFEFYSSGEKDSSATWVCPALILIPKSDLGIETPEVTNIYFNKIKIYIDKE